MSWTSFIHVAAVAAGTLLVRASDGAVEVYVDDEGRAAWEADVGTWNTMDFTGFEPGHNPTDEYLESVGAVFTDGFNQVLGPIPVGFPEDGWGLESGGFASTIEFELVAPTLSLAVLYPGGMNIELWNGDELVFDAGVGGGGFGNFRGIVSTVPFDRVRLDDNAGVAYVDDIRVGVLIPGPGAAAMLATALLGGQVRGRRRRG